MNRKYPAYLDWIRGLQCESCGWRPPSEAHHLKGEFHQSGAGLKAPDYLAMPLCPACHDDIQLARDGWKELQRGALIRTLIRAFEEGMIAVYSDGVDDPIPIRPLETKDGNDD